MQPCRGQTRAADKIGGAKMSDVQQRMAGASDGHRWDYVGRFQREMHQIQVCRRMRVW